MLNDITKFLREYKNLENNNIDKDSKLIVDLGFTSYDIVEMCCHLEDMYDSEINEEDISKIETVGDIVKYLEKKVK